MSKRNDIRNYRTDYSIFKIICSLPEEYLHDKYFDFVKIGLTGKWDGLIGHSFNEFLDRLISINNKELILKGVGLLLTHREVEGSFEKIHSILAVMSFKEYYRTIKKNGYLRLG